MHSCLHCGAETNPEMKFCGNCGSSLKQSPQPRPRPALAPPPKKNTAWLIVPILLLGILAAVLFFIWQRQLGPFYPQFQVEALSAAQLEGSAEIAAPSPAERERFAAFAGSFENRSYQRLSSEEKQFATDMYALAELLATGGAIGPESLAAIFTSLDAKGIVPTFKAADTGGLSDMNSLLQSLIGNAPSESENEESSGDGSSGLNTLLESFGQLIGSSTESGENAETNPLPAVLAELRSEATEESIQEPVLPPHGSWPRLSLSSAADAEITCRSCGGANTAKAETCQHCGADLSRPLLYAEIEAAPPPPEETLPEERPAYTAQMLNNIANEMMLQGYADLPFFLACLAAVEDPLDTDVICTIANLLKNSEDFENALACAEYALRLAPNEEDLLYTAGMTCLKMNDADRAASFFNRALRVSGGGGPGNQGMMLVSVMRQDFPSAFLYMLEGGRDGFTSSIWQVYQMMKLRPDYKELSGRIFDQYSLMQLMNFTRCRTAFDPTLDTVGQQISLGRLSLPDSVRDWHASAPELFLECLEYAKETLLLYAEDARQVMEVFDILFSAEGLEDLGHRFQASSLAPRKKTEAEEMVSYEQEMFWLSILNDYMDWELQKIHDKRDASYTAAGIDEIADLIQHYVEEVNGPVFERGGGDSFDLAAYLEATTLMVSMLEGNNTLLLTYEQSQHVVSLMDAGLGQISYYTNQAYEETRILCEEYWLYANAILGLIADDTIYNDYRKEQRDKVVGATAPYVMEAGAYSFLVVIVYDGVAILGKPAVGGIATGLIPEAPRLPISGKGATPYALMYGDVYVPNIPEVVREVIGLTEEEIEESIRIQMEREKQDDFEKWWREASAEERIRYQALQADPSVLTRRLILQPYPGSGQGIISIYTEDATTPEPSASFSRSFGKNAAKVSIDTNGNVSLQVKDMVGITANPDDVTVFVGKSVSLPIDSLPLGGGVSVSTGVEADAKAKLYATYNHRKGKFTSGGLKAGAVARLGSAIGAETKLGHNVVTGISSGDISLIWNGKKIVAHGAFAWR